MNHENKENEGPAECRITLSSKHLAVASPVFSRMFQLGFKEGSQLATGDLELSLPEDDSDAMLVFLHVIHGRVRSVPRALSLSKLVQLALLADKYDCAEPLGLFVGMWAGNVPGIKPHFTTGGSLLRWLCISWVFKREDFTTLTALAQKTSERLLVADDLVIPDRVLGKSWVTFLQCRLLIVTSRDQSKPASRFVRNLQKDQVNSAPLLR